MRRAFLAILALLSVVSVAHAQISVIPAPPITLTLSPRFMAAADFNRDGIKDVVVTNATSRRVSVLFGASSGSFSPVINLNVGNVLRGIAAGDLNNDGNPDIAVVDFLAGKVFIAYGNGPDGTFRLPFSTAAGARPIDIALGNFDAINGTDLVVANETSAKASILKNAGSNRGFEAPFGLPAGKSPTRVDAADLNADGFDDVITVNSGTRPADSISVLINAGNGSFPNLPTNFVVGAGAADMAVGDFNSDGAPDILVLNAGQSGVDNQFSVSVLLNKTVVKNGRRIGTGSFFVQQPVTVPCPRSLGGVSVTCTPHFMSAGDLDADGNLDFAVSFGTIPTIQGFITPGIVEVFQGHGDGSFDFSLQQNVGVNAQGLVIGDFTGDNFPDIAVASQGNNTVVLLKGVAPPPGGKGTSCNVGAQCASGLFCVDKKCCDSASCPTGEFCDIPLHLGSCTAPADNGSHPCTSDTQCSSGFCTDGFCCEAETCPDGQACNTGQCSGPTDNGTPCNAPSQCLSGFCTDGSCCISATCPVGTFCHIPGSEGQCAAPLPVPHTCTVGTQCETGACIDGVCCGSVQCFPGQTCSCPLGEGCAVPGQEGQCVVLPTPTSTPTMTTTPTRTPTPQINGAPCTSGGQCISTNCVDNTCCNVASCPDSLVCNMPNAHGMCASKNPVGDTCNDNSQCISNNCQGTTCAGTRTPTPTLTATPVPGGGICTTTAQCSAGYVCNTVEHVCCFDSTCPNGQSCRVPGSGGVCTSPPTNTPQPTVTITPTPTPTRIQNGVGCSPNNPDVCASGLCTDNVCCTSATCTAPARCDIFGNEGDCTQPLPADIECSKNSDCAEGLICSFDIQQNKDVCTIDVPPPTFPPVNTPTAPADPIIHTSRGGGCSIADSSDGTGAWLLTALPIAFWMRRRQHVRVQRCRVSK